MIRATSLSGIANRYVSLAPGPNNAPELADGATLTGDNTTSPGRPRPALRHLPAPARARRSQNVIQGSPRSTTGNTAGASSTYKYFAPGAGGDPAAVRRADQRPAGASASSSSRARRRSDAIAERRNDLPTLTANANQALGRDREPEPGARPLAGRPSRRRCARRTPPSSTCAPRSTTSTPLVNDVQAGDQGPGAVPAQAAAGRASARSRSSATCGWRSTGPGRTTTSPTRCASCRRSSSKAQQGGPAGDRRRSNASQPVIEFARPYTPDLLGLPLQVRPGHRLLRRQRPLRPRLDRATPNLFHYCTPATRTRSAPAQAGRIRPASCADPAEPAVQRPRRSGPSPAARAARPSRSRGSNPFTDDGNLLTGGQPPNPKCDTSDVPPGP